MSKTLAQIAEEWYTKQGNTVPDKNSPEYTEMYEKWIEFAFADFPESK